MMKAQDLPREFATEAAKGFPPVAVTATSITGTIDWQTSVYVLTAMYLLLQIIWLLWKAWDRARGKGKAGD